MVMSSRPFIRMTDCVCLTAVVCIMVSCSSGYYTANANGETKVYRVDEQGAKTLVYETDQQGKTTIYDADDPMVKRHAAAQELAAELSANRAEQREPLSHAPKRQANDPIYVDLAPAVLDEPMQKAERAKGAVAEQIRSEFMEDPIIKLVDRSQTRSGLLKPHVSASPDVEVSPKVSLKEAYGIDRKTGKPSKVFAVVFEATIISQVPAATYTVSESGHALKNLEISKRFAKQVKQVILEKIGPNIPAH